MPTQDTITIPRDLGAWLDACHLEPRSTPGVDQERYTAKAAHGLLARALDAEPPVPPEPTTTTAWSRAQARRIAQHTEEHGSALDDVSRLRQELATAKAAYSEKIATFEDDRAAALAERSARAGMARDATLTADGIEPDNGPQLVKLELTIRHEFAAARTPEMTDEEMAAFDAR